MSVDCCEPWLVRITPTFCSDANVAAGRPDGCSTSDPAYKDIASIEDRADLLSIGATSLLVTGGALVIGGGALLYLNRERPVTVRRESISVAPMLGSDIVGLGAAGRF